MKITNELLDNLTAQAKQSERLRMAYDLRTSSDDRSQRMLNAMEPGTILPIHRHRRSSESCAVLRGAIRENFYDNEGNLIETFDLKAGSSLAFCQIPKGAWHNTESLESGTIIFEAKDGAYTPLTDEDILKK